MEASLGSCEDMAVRTSKEKVAAAAGRGGAGEGGGGCAACCCSCCGENETAGSPAMAAETGEAAAGAVKVGSKAPAVLTPATEGGTCSSSWIHVGAVELGE